MTNAELIQAFRAKIERRIKECEATYPKDKGGYWFPEQEEAYAIAEEYKQLLSFLDTLESEKPMNQDEMLNEEIKKEMAKLPFFIRGKDLIAYARHFAKWGKEQGYREGFLEGAKTQREEDNQLVDTIYQQGIEKGKDDMKEQAVSGTLAYEPHLRRIIVNLDDIPDGAWNGGGTPVEVIIFKKEQATKEVN